MADLEKRLLQSYLNTTLSTKLLRKGPAKPRRWPWVLVAGLGVAGAVWGWKKLAKTVPTDTAATVQASVQANSAPPQAETGPLMQRLGQLSTGLQHFEQVPVRDVLLRLEESCRNIDPAGKNARKPPVTFTCADELARVWDTYPEQEPRVTLHVFGCAVVHQLKLVAAQAELVLDFTENEVRFLPTPELKQLPSGAWQRQLDAPAVERWLAQQNKLRGLAANWHEKQAISCLRLGSYQEAKMEAEKLLFLAPNHPTARTQLLQAAEEQSALAAFEAQPLLSGVATLTAYDDPLANVPPKNGHRVISYSLPQLLAQHGLPGQPESSLLTIADNVRHIRIAEALLAALEEGVRPIWCLNVHHISAKQENASHMLGIHSQEKGAKLLAGQKPLAEATSAPLCAGHEAKISLPSSERSLHITELHQTGEKLDFHWVLGSPEGANLALGLPVVESEFVGEGNASLATSQWLEIPDDSVPGSAWLVQFTNLP